MKNRKNKLNGLDIDSKMVACNEKSADFAAVEDSLKESDEARVNMVRQNSNYKGTKCQPDNNIFFEERSNPLSSKGN